MNFVNRLNKCSDFSCIFELVKSAVESTIKKRRVGLMLGLSDLPLHIGALHQLGSNFIIMNKILLEKIVNLDNKKLTNAYIFHVLLHEYLHSLGCVNEQETQNLTYLISEKILGPDHQATLIAKYGIGAIFAGMSRFDYQEPEKFGGIEIIQDFEDDNLDYFG